MSKAWKFASSAQQVMPYLWIGNAGAASDIMLLHQRGINKILSCGSEFKEYNRTEIESVVLDIPDNTWNESTADEFQKGVHQVLEWMGQGHTVLVHCMGGISRSATVVLLLLMRINNIRLDEAVELLVSKRPQVGPVTSYWVFLMREERRLEAGKKP